MNVFAMLVHMYVSSVAEIKCYCDIIIRVSQRKIMKKIKKSCSAVSKFNRFIVKSPGGPNVKNSCLDPYL